MTYDLLIKDGTIIDGSGKPRFKGDIGVSDGKIKGIGAPALAGAAAKKTISAFDKFVTPGFVDITSHADKNWSLFHNPGQDYLLTQGITTILVGNCGSSLAPLPSHEAVDSLKKWSQGGESNINWLTIGELLAELSRHKLGVNVGTLIGHGTIRRGILKGQSRPLNNEELAELAELIKKGIDEGAFGLSTGLIYSHEADATVTELVMMAGAVSSRGGIYKTHLRHEGASLVPAVNEAVQIGREARVPIVISHLKAIGRKSWPLFKKGLEILERAASDGVSFHFDSSPYLRTGSFLYLLLPAWAREGGFDAMLKRINNSASRRDIVDELKKQTLHYERYIVATSSVPGTNSKTLAEIAQSAGASPEDAVLELLLANRGRVTVFGKTLSSRNLLLGLKHPRGIVASDGSGVSSEIAKTGKLVHPRSTGTFPHFLHRFVKEKELVSWEEGIRKMTALAAEAAGFKDRGRIAEKYAADIAIFDPEKFRDHSTYHNPYVHSTGIEAVVVNGQVAIENSTLTGAAAGQALKKT